MCTSVCHKFLFTPLSPLCNPFFIAEKKKGRTITAKKQKDVEKTKKSKNIQHINVVQMGEEYLRTYEVHQTLSFGLIVIKVSFRHLIFLCKKKKKGKVLFFFNNIHIINYKFYCFYTLKFLYLIFFFVFFDCFITNQLVQYFFSKKKKKTAREGIQR